MLINEKTAISTPKILLVPYCKHHVPTYHQWMQDPALQAATASEPLSLEQESAMQSRWHHDVDKLTFIVCLPFTADNEEPPPDVQAVVRGGEQDAEERMLGDVNLFLSSRDSSPHGDIDAPLTGELSLMIAPSRFRNLGYGRAALRAFLQYLALHEMEIVAEYYKDRDRNRGTKNQVTEERRIECVRVKIGEGNVSSLGLFGSVGFRRVEGGNGEGEGGNWFGEVEMRLEEGLGTVSRKEGVEGWREVGYEVGREEG